MLFAIALCVNLLLVPAVVALPAGSGPHITRRRGGVLSKTTNPLGQSTDMNFDTGYSTNWAGALQNNTNGAFTSVTGTFTVPTPSGAVGDGAAVWVGIDGDACNVILQTGVAFTVESGGPEYIAWVQWFPAPSGEFVGFQISAGDIIELSVHAFSSTSGSVTVDNLTSGQTASANMTSSTPLCGQSAEWIVEDYADDSAGDLVPLADFGSVTFTNAEATGTKTYTPSGATEIDIEQNGQVLTSVSTSGSSVTIKYV